MYYKIENKDCEVYKKLYQMRTEEYKMAADNVTAIDQKVGLVWDTYLGDSTQQQISRLPTYKGFEFIEPQKVNYTTWKRHSKHKDVFVPNRKTKRGKEMYQFLTTGLKVNLFFVVYDCLGIEQPIGRFSFPYVEICSGIIILCLSDKIFFTDENIIEITTKEANLLLNQRHGQY